MNICQVHLGALNKTLEVNSLPFFTMMEIIKIAAEFMVCSIIVCSALNAEITKDDVSFTRTICKSSLGEENISLLRDISSRVKEGFYSGLLG